jgi:hypothetical protein
MFKGLQLVQGFNMLEGSNIVIEATKSTKTLEIYLHSVTCRGN